MSGSFRNPSPNEIFGTADSSENLWILPLVGPRPRLDGAKHYDLVCEKDPLLLTYGFVSQALWIMEERLFNDPELNDRQKAMNALWARWLALYRYSFFVLADSFLFLDLTLFRVDFIENSRLCCTNFLEHRYEIIHHAAGWDAFRSWILVSERIGSLHPRHLLRNVDIILGSQIQQLPHTKRDDFYHRAIQPESGTRCGLCFIYVRSANHLGTMHRGLSLDVIQEHGF